MNDTAPPIDPRIDEFIRRWQSSGAAERANYALFLTQLCDLVGVPQPDPTTPDAERNAYVFERDVTFQEPDGTTSIGRIDLYKRSCFVLEAKQGSDAAIEEGVLFSRGARTARRKRGAAVRLAPAPTPGADRLAPAPTPGAPPAAQSPAWGPGLSEKERRIHDAGLVSVLKQIHDRLDAAVFAAYGWPADLTDEQILERLVALNAERASEEARGLVRWLRPEFQCRPARPSLAGGGEDVATPAKSKRRSKLTLVPSSREIEEAIPGAQLADRGLAGAKSRRGAGRSGPERPTKREWPAEQAARTRAVQAALASAAEPLTAAEMARHFHRARQSVVEEILEALVSLGLARRLRGGKYAS